MIGTNKKKQDFGKYASHTNLKEVRDSEKGPLAPVESKSGGNGAMHGVKGEATVISNKRAGCGVVQVSVSVDLF